MGDLNLKVVCPLPTKRLKKLFSQFKKEVTIEVAYGDDYKSAPLASAIRMQTLAHVESVIANATGRPIKPTQIMELIEAETQGVSS